MVAQELKEEHTCQEWHTNKRWDKV